MKNLHNLSIAAVIAVFALALLMPAVKAFSLGSVVKNDYAKISSGESAKFTALFWNVEENSYRVNLEVKEAPDDWLIIIQPQSFPLNSSIGGEYVSLPYMNKPVKAVPVDIFVKPNGDKGGRYNVVIVASAGSPDGGISFFQGRQLKLTVDLAGEQTQTTIVRETTTTTTEPQPSEEVAQTNFNFILYPIVFVCVLVVSLIIYKYA